MSLQTLQQDPRYRAVKRQIETQPISIADPALMRGDVPERFKDLVAEALAIAVDHGWDPDTDRWMR